MKRTLGLFLTVLLAACSAQPPTIHHPRQVPGDPYTPMPTNVTGSGWSQAVDARLNGNLEIDPYLGSGTTGPGAGGNVSSVGATAPLSNTGTAQNPVIAFTSTIGPTVGGTGFSSNLTIPACTLYASPSGSGTACSVGTPCTIAQAMTNAVAGSVVCLNNGSYNWVSGNATINVPNVGTLQQPLWIRPTNIVNVIASNYPTINTPLVKISASGGNGTLGIYPTGSGIANNVVVYGLEIDGTAGTAPSSGIAFGGTPAGGSSHIWIINNLIHNWGGNGIGEIENDYLTVMDNVVHDNSALLTSCGSAISDYEPLNFDTLPGIHNIIAGNIAYNTTQPAGHSCSDGEGIIFDDGDHTQSNGVPYTGDTLIENNLAYNNAGKCVQVFSTSHATEIVRNNTCYHNYTSSQVEGKGFTGELVAQSAYGVIFTNNIVWPNATGNGGNNVGVGVASSVFNGIQIVGNFCETDAGAQACWWNSSGGAPNPGQLNYFAGTQNPQFTSAGTNFTLGSNSPAIRAGQRYYGQPLTDILGVQRIPGRVDLGAFASASPGLLPAVPKVTTEADEPIFTGNFNSLIFVNGGMAEGGGSSQYGSSILSPIGTPAAPTIISGFTSGTSFFYWCVAEDINGLITPVSPGTGTTGSNGTMACGPQNGTAYYFLLRTGSSTPPSGSGSYQIAQPVVAISGHQALLSDAGFSPQTFVVAATDQTDFSQVGYMQLGHAFTPAQLTSFNNGTLAWCPTCALTSGEGSACTTGGTGALAFRVNSTWKCF